MASLLSDAEKEQYVAEQVSAATAGVKPSSGSKPKAVILAGQPGSGKGALATAAMAAAKATGGAVKVDPDECRATHPLYEKLALEDDRTAADKTHEDASEAARAITQAAIEAGLDLVIDGTLKSPDKAKALVKQLVDAGYEVEVVGLCVDPKESWAGVQERYAKQRQQLGYGRSVPREVHDAAVTGMVDSLEALREQGLVSTMQIVNRAGAVLLECSPSAEKAAGESHDGEINDVFVEHGGRSSPDDSQSTSSGGSGRPAARLTDPTTHGTPLSPGTGSPNVLIGFLPAWRALPAGAGAALQSAQSASDAAVKTAEAATVAAAGTPGAPAAYAAEQATKAAAAAAMASMMASLVAGASASTGGLGTPDTHVCPVPTPVPPHGPGYVIDGSATVLVNGLPLSRQQDTVVEALGGPDKILLGELTVLVGG